MILETSFVFSTVTSVTEEDIFKYAGLIGDHNSVDLDAEYAKITISGKRITQGLHSAAFFTTPIATRLPGLDGVYIPGYTFSMNFK